MKTNNTNDNQENIKQENETLEHQTSNQENQSEEKDTQIDFEKKYKEDREKFLLIIAEYENKMKRTQIDAQNYSNKIVERIVLEIIPLIDDLNSAIQIASKEVQTGLEMIMKNLKKILISHEIIEIIPEQDEPFNIEIHQAIGSEGVDFETAKIKQVLKTGYKFHQKVIMPAMVILQ